MVLGRPSSISLAQLVPVYSQYLLNQSVINPGYIGIDNCLNINALYGIYDNELHIYEIINQGNRKYLIIENVLYVIAIFLSSSANILTDIKVRIINATTITRRPSWRAEFFKIFTI